MIDFPGSFKLVCNVFFPFRALLDTHGVMEQDYMHGILKLHNKEHEVQNKGATLLAVLLLNISRRKR